MARVPSLRASDAEREEVAERLQQATGEGRLTPDELEERLAAVRKARTYGQLDAQVADLPAPRNLPARSTGGIPAWVFPAGALALLVSTLSVLGNAAHDSSEAYERRGAVAGAHHLAVAASTVTVFALVAICAALFWLLRRSKNRSRQ